MIIEKYIPVHSDPAAQTLMDVAYEMRRGRAKFPGNGKLTVALGEEFGELCRAQLQRQGLERVRAEALQVAGIALRIYEEGDADFDSLTDEQAKP